MSRQRYNSSQFAVYMFQEDYNEVIKDTVLKHLDCETGGDLFGLWTGDRHGLKPLVHIVLGPGKQCTRNKYSFYQDVSYLKQVGTTLANDYMLGHIGEWHSHHRLTLCEPSSGDYRTVRKNYPRGYHGFLLIIANILPNMEVTLSPFLFKEDTEEIMRGKVILIAGRSPFRADGRLSGIVNQGAEGRGGQVPRTPAKMETQCLVSIADDSRSDTTEQIPTPTDTAPSNNEDASSVAHQENDYGLKGIVNQALEEETATSPNGAEGVACPDPDVEMSSDFWYQSAEDRDKKLDDMLGGMKCVTVGSEEPFSLSFTFSGEIDKKKAAEMLSKLQEIAGDEKINLSFAFDRDSSRWTVELPADYPRSHATLQRFDPKAPGQAKAEIKKDDIQEVFNEISRAFKKREQAVPKQQYV